MFKFRSIYYETHIYILNLKLAATSSHYSLNYNRLTNTTLTYYSYQPQPAGGDILDWHCCLLSFIPSPINVEIDILHQKVLIQQRI